MDCIRPVVISGHEERLNRGEAEIVSILESRLQDTEQGFRAEFEEQLLFGNVPSMSDSVTLTVLSTQQVFLSLEPQELKQIRFTM